MPLTISLKGLLDSSTLYLPVMAATITVPLFLSLMRRVSSYTAKGHSEKSLDDLSWEYGKWEFFAFLALCVFIPVITFALYFIFSALAPLFLPESDNTAWTIQVPDAMWYLPSFFAAILLSAIPTHFLFLAILGEKRYAEYTHFSNLKAGFDGWKVLRASGYFLFPIIAVALLFSWLNYAVITEDRIIVNLTFELTEKNYSFDQISALELVRSFRAPNGNINRANPYIVIRFTDGSSLDFHSFLHNATIQTQVDILKMVSTKSKVSVKIIEADG